MSILKAYILPHGAITLNPEDYQDYPELQILHDSLKAVGDEIANLKPDLIVLTTPHGIAMSKSFGVYINNDAYGTAEWDNSWKDFAVNTKLDNEVSEGLLAHIEEKKSVNIQGVTAFVPSASISLRWGEVIPLWFIHEAYKRSIKKDEANELPKSIILSLPRRRLTEPDKMIPECLELGKGMTEFLLNLNKRTVLVFSGDLAHTHKIIKGSFMADTQIYPIKEDASQFDEAIEEWAKNPLEKEETLLKCGSVCSEFLSCGYTGFVVLQGMLKELNTKANFKIESKVLCNYHPTYYGMMVAAFSLLQDSL